MSWEAAKTLVENLDRRIGEREIGKAHFNDPNVRAFPLQKDGFKTIREMTSNSRLAFVDGGNQEVVGAPNFSVQLNRAHVSAWDGKFRAELNFPRIEFFSATFSSFRDDEIYYDTVLVPGNQNSAACLPDAEDLSFNSFDRSIMNGNQRADIGRVASIARRFAEWKVATNVLEKLNPGDILVMDGTLQTSFPNENNYITDLVEAAKDRGVILCGLSKTSALFTTTGLSLLGAINQLADECKIAGGWYFPLAESTSAEHNVMIFVVKLHTISDHVFRFEIERNQFKSFQENDLNEILSLLAINSSDATFPGYPYGLVEADRFARVSMNELEYYRGLILSHMSSRGKWDKFSQHIFAGDAHSILNALVG